MDGQTDGHFDLEGRCFENINYMKKQATMGRYRKYQEEKPGKTEINKKKKQKKQEERNPVIFMIYPFIFKTNPVILRKIHSYLGQIQSY